MYDVKMCPKCNELTDCACFHATGIMEGEGGAHCSRYLSRLSGNSDLSAVDTACENSELTLVYKRRKFEKKPITAILPHVSAKNTHMGKGLVYWRRKHYNPDVVFHARVLENASLNDELSGALASRFRTENPSLVMKKHTDHEASNEPDGVKSSKSVVICSDDPVLTNDGAIDGCLTELHGSDVKGKGDDNVELNSGVYHRRKHYNPAVVFPTGVNVTPNAKLSGDRASFCRSENPSLIMGKNTDHTVSHEIEGVRSSLSVAICTNEPVPTHTGAIDGCLAKQHGSDVKEDNNVDLHSVIYQRRKHYNPLVVFSTGVLKNVLPNAELYDDHASSLRSENPSLATMKHTDHTASHETEGVRSSLSVVMCSNELDLPHARAINGCLTEQHVSDVKAKGENNVDLRRFVYWRRKHYNPAVVFPTGLLENVSPNAMLSGDHASFPRLENRSLGMEKHTDHIASHEIEGVRSSISGAICSDEPVLTHSGAIDECLAEQRGSDVKGEGHKNVELHSVDDSCSSSMVNIDAGSAPLNMEVEENGECSSSDAFVGELIGEDMSERDRCISILKSHGLLSCLLPNKSCTFEEDIASCSGAGNSCSCNVCGHLGSTENMLICDQCEEAFHVSCCNPAMRKISFDEWFCQYCFKKKHKIMKETTGPRSAVIRSELSFRPAASKAKTSPIALMLKDGEPYTTGVRIGKDFQAVVPCWSGPITECIDFSGEQTELNPSDISSFHVLSSEHPPKPMPITNWLQCQDVIVGSGERDGTICGKWRRAPLFEVQTDDWDCFSSIFWDPMHADCAAPQELETDEVLKQLKYIEMLRPRLEAKKRKAGCC